MRDPKGSHYALLVFEKGGSPEAISPSWTDEYYAKKTSLISEGVRGIQNSALIEYNVKDDHRLSHPRFPSLAEGTAR